MTKPSNQHVASSVGILAAKVRRQDSLARFLSQRPNRKELMDRNIIPVPEVERQEQKMFINNKLNRCEILFQLCSLCLI